VDQEIEIFWRQALGGLSCRTYQHGNSEISVSVNWKRLVERIRADNGLRRQVDEGHPPKNWLERILKPLSLSTKVIIRGGEATTLSSHYAAHFVEVFLHEVFLIANFTAPGSAEFWKLSFFGGEYERDIRLSAFSFDVGWTSHLNGDWPEVRALPYERVLRWFAAVDMGCRQRPRSGVESALYVLLHMAKGGDAYIDSIVWLFHGFETLVSTKVGENFAGLVRRLSLVLDLDVSKQEMLRKKLRELYNLRSAFVHGGYPIPHPLQNSVIDNSLAEHINKVFDLWCFGTFLLISTLQALILKGAISFEFDERLIVRTIE